MPDADSPKKEKKGKKAAASPKKKKDDVSPKKKKDASMPGAAACDPSLVVHECVKPPPDIDDAEEDVRIIVVADEQCDVPAMLTLYATGTVPKAKEKLTTFKAKRMGMRVMVQHPDEPLPEQVTVNATVAYSSTPREGDLRSADIILLCYTPVKDRGSGSLEQARREWIPALRGAAPEVMIALCGTRLDLIAKQAKKGAAITKTSTVAEVVEREGLATVFEVSTKNNKGVKAALESTAALVVRQRRGEQLPSYKADDAELQRLKDMRVVNKSADKSTWRCLWSAANNAFYYRNTKTKAKSKTRPKDFDGVDYAELEKLEKVAMLDRLRQARELQERTWAEQHEEKIQTLQVTALDAAVTVSRLEAELEQVQLESRRLGEKRRTWEARLAAVERDRKLDKEREEREEFVHSDETTEKRSLEQTLQNERQMLHNKVKSDEQLSQLCKQFAETNMQLALAVKPLHREGEILSAKLTAVQTAVEKAKKHNQTLQNMIETSKETHTDLAERREKLETERKQLLDKRQELQSQLTAKREFVSTLNIAVERGEKQEEGLTRDIGKLEIDILQHKDEKNVPTATTSRAWLERLVEDRTEWVRDMADVSADVVQQIKQVSKLRSKFLEQSLENQGVYDENLRLLSVATPLPMKIVHIFTRHGEHLRKKLARLATKKATVHRDLDALEAELGTDIHEVLKTPPELSQESMPSLCDRMRALSRQQKQTEAKLYTTMKKADVCTMEHEHVERLQMVRLEERACQAEFAKGVIQHVDRWLREFQEEAPGGLALGQPLQWSIWDTASAPGVAFKYSSGLLAETQANMVATEAYVMKRREYKKQARDRREREHWKIMKILDATEVDLAVRKGQKVRDSGAPQDVVANTFGKAAAEFQRKQNFEISRVERAGDEHQRLPGDLLGIAPPHPKRISSCFRTTSAPYNICTAKAWERYTSGKVATWE